MERGRIQGLSKFFWYPLLSQQRVKLRTSNFVGTFIGTKAHENIGNSGRGRSQRVPKIFRAPICRAHCAVIFAIAQLSCYHMQKFSESKGGGAWPKWPNGKYAYVYNVAARPMLVPLTSRVPIIKQA